MKSMETDKSVADFVSKASASRPVTAVHPTSPGMSSYMSSTEPNLFHVLQVHEQPPILKRTIPTPHYAKDLVSPQKTRLNFYLDQRQQVQTHQPNPPPSWSPISPGTPRPVTVSSPSPREKANVTTPRVVHVHGREHLEVRACMLAHRYRLDVDQLVKSHDDHRQSVAELKQQRRATLLPNTANAQESARRKTQFLLDHYFGVHDSAQPCISPAAATGTTPPLRHPHKAAASSSPCPMTRTRKSLGSSTSPSRGGISDGHHVLLDVVDEWSLHADATTSDVESFWQSVTAHMESSYVMQATVVDAAHPHALAVHIALDCLTKVADHLPSYARLLHVLKVVLERALYVPDPVTPPPNDKPSIPPRQLYVDQLAATQKSLDDCMAQIAAHKASQRVAPLDKIAGIVASAASDAERHELLLNVVGQHLPQSTLGMDVVVAAATHASVSDQLTLMASVVAQRSLHDMQPLLLAIHNKHKHAMAMFMEDHADAMEALVLDDGGRGVQRVMEANGPFFSDLFLRAPSLLNNALQAPTLLLSQVVEQNRSAIAHVLGQKPDVFLHVLATALKDNNLLALEEYLVKTPKALRDVLLNRPTLLSGIVKSSPSILTDVLVNAKAAFARVVTEVPDHLTAVFNAHPSSIGTMFAASGDMLGPILDQCPQALTAYLENAPETIVDIAHRAPKLLSMLFARFPDLLVEPLEMNPTVLATFLASHKEILHAMPVHDFMDASSGGGPFRKLAMAATQTGSTCVVLYTCYILLIVRGYLYLCKYIVHFN
ncbi:hypothetical protein, variant [Aphanomyces astaci]|uniref:Uncharacterized protein n=1 Tax=Aphanomyces astaci TaxID=112090 RepID=W4GCH7_APHAT|nr:hypothetical protein, variant [Aphanomyces astaci]ETV77375.1 hypothetical protein, variant [Aphanomyces astaci]|eukprot:XP_009833162.1 hypothetical protein, variant [Aphanomyces astaci]